MPVDEPELTAQLMAAVMDDIIESRDTVDVAYPDDLVDFNDEKAIEFVLFPNERASHPSRKTLTVDMMPSLLADNPEQGVKAELRFLDGDRNQLGRATLHECLAAEVLSGGERFCLADGTYYHVNAEFVARIDETLGEIPIWDVPLPRYGGGREDEWIEGVADGGDFIVLDKSLITLPGETPFEPADLVHRDGALIHAKRKGRSSALSYLSVQASTSAQLLASPDAVTQLRALVNERGSEELRTSVGEALAVLDQTKPDLDVVLYWPSSVTGTSAQFGISP